MARPAWHSRVLFGAADYHEYQPPAQWGAHALDEGFRLKRQAGFSVIRVGESVWSTWNRRTASSSWTGSSRCSTPPGIRASTS